MEDAGWGSAFHREDNSPPRPTYTGTGLIDVETAREIVQGGGEFQISVWPKRAKTGAKYLRIHIEPMYQASEDGELEDDEFDGPAVEADADEDDLPF